MLKKLRPTPMSIDFSKATDRRQYKSGIIRDDGTPAHRALGNLNAPRLPDGKLLTAKQIRSRARRRFKRAEIMSKEEFEKIYKPIEEWDLEELAKGRPKNSRGSWSGPKPSWISRDVHEKSMERFKNAIRTEMNHSTVSAMDAINWVLGNNEVDERGKPLVPASTKLDAAKFLLEHVVGKPTQRIENDVSVKLQSILGVVMANPAEALTSGPNGYNVGHLPGVTMPMVIEGDIVDEDIDETEEE